MRGEHRGVGAHLPSRLRRDDEGCRPLPDQALASTPMLRLDCFAFARRGRLQHRRHPGDSRWVGHGRRRHSPVSRSPAQRRDTGAVREPVRGDPRLLLPGRRHAVRWRPAWRSRLLHRRLGRPALRRNRRTTAVADWCRLVRSELCLLRPVHVAWRLRAHLELQVMDHDFDCAVTTGSAGTTDGTAATPAASFPTLLSGRSGLHLRTRWRQRWCLHGCPGLR